MRRRKKQSNAGYNVEPIAKVTEQAPAPPLTPDVQPDHAQSRQEGRGLIIASRLLARLKTIDSNQWMAGFTALLFLVALFQWDLTRETFRAGNRAYLGVRDVKVFQTGPPGPSGRVAITEDSTHLKLSHHHTATTVEDLRPDLI